MTWRVALTPRAQRDLRRLETTVAERVLAALERLATAGAGDVKRLRGEPGLRLRVGDWRVLFTYDRDVRAIRVARILPRGRAYRG